MQVMNKEVITAIATALEVKVISITFEPVEATANEMNEATGTKVEDGKSITKDSKWVRVKVDSDQYGLFELINRNNHSKVYLSLLGKARRELLGKPEGKGKRGNFVAD